MPTSIRALAIEVAIRGGNLALERFRQPQVVALKGPVDLVTQTDRDVEHLIAAAIAERFPHHRVLGEEGTAIGSLQEHLWVVDPLDGTINYAHGYPNFSVSIAYLVGGQVVLGVVYGPTREELFVAERGQGAYLGEQRISVSSIDQLIRGLIATGFPYDREARLPQTVRTLQALLENVQNVRADGSAALDLCYLAAGRFDGFWENDLKAWDTAAGSLVLTEAGGTITAGNGEPYTIDCREVLASNGILHQELLALVNGVRQTGGFLP